MSLSRQRLGHPSYYDPGTGRFLSEDPFGFSAGANFYTYVGSNAPNFVDPSGSQQVTGPMGLTLCKFKSCGIKKAPKYDVAGDVQGGTTFSWHAEFLNDDTHDPKCCEVRQLISWAAGKPAHPGFQPPRDQPNRWYEDRDHHNKRYGRRTGPYSDLQPGFDYYSGNNYDGNDTPQYAPGSRLRFRLIVVDVCNGGKTLYTSNTINVNF